MKAGFYSVTLFFLLALATSVHAEEPKGFLKWPWGTPVDDLVQDDSWCRFQTKKVDRDKKTIYCSVYQIGDIKVNGLTLFFEPSNALTGYLIAAESNAFAAMRTTTIDKFGRPTSTETNQFRTRIGVLVPGEQLLWRWPSGTTASLSNMPRLPLPMMFLSVYTKVLDDIEEKKAEATKQKRREGF